MPIDLLMPDRLGLARLDLVGWSDGHSWLDLEMQHPVPTDRLLAACANAGPAGLHQVFDGGIRRCRADCYAPSPIPHRHDERARRTVRMGQGTPPRTRSNRARVLTHAAVAIGSPDTAMLQPPSLLDKAVADFLGH